MHSRVAAFQLLNDERNYQDQKWSPERHQHNPTEWLVFIQDYLTEAVYIATREDDATANTKVMANIRKIGAMCVAAIEQNGAPPR